jgi:hypothetical protein
MTVQSGPSLHVLVCDEQQDVVVRPRPDGRPSNDETCLRTHSVYGPGSTPEVIVIMPRPMPVDARWVIYQDYWYPSYYSATGSAPARWINGDPFSPVGWLARGTGADYAGMWTFRTDNVYDFYQTTLLRLHGAVLWHGRILWQGTSGVITLRATR